MHLESSSLICGFPALEIRKVLRAANGSDLWERQLADILKLESRCASVLREDLVAAGYLRPSESFRPGWEVYVATEKGARVANANALRQITRATATRLLDGLLERMHALETHPRFVMHVAKAVVFGSYTRGAERLSDVDVGYLLEGRGADKEARVAAMKARINSVRQYRQFGSLFQELMLPENEVLIFLRNRSGYLSFHRMDREGEDEIVARGNPVQIYPVELPPTDQSGSSSSG
jgi:predicted nucleotidyltransferase